MQDYHGLRSDSSCRSVYTCIYEILLSRLVPKQQIGVRAAYLERQVSANDLSAYGSMSEGIERVTGIIICYALLEQLHFSENPKGDPKTFQHLRKCIVNIYAIILSNLARCKKYWAHSSAMRTVQSVSGKVEAIASVLKIDLSKADDEVQRVLQMVQSQGLSSEIAKVRQDLEKTLISMEKPLWRTA